MSIGVWRSWLAHLHGVQGVESSSLFTPTKERGDIVASLFFRLRISGYGGSVRTHHVRPLNSGFWILDSGFNPHSSLRLPQCDSPTDCGRMQRVPTNTLLTFSFQFSVFSFQLLTVLSFLSELWRSPRCGDECCHRHWCFDCLPCW